MINLSKSKSINDSKPTKFHEPQHINGKDNGNFTHHTHSRFSRTPGSVIEKFNLEKLKETTLKNMNTGVHAVTPMAREDCIDYALEMVISNLIMNGHLEPTEAPKMRSTAMKCQIAKICEEMIVAKSEIMSKASTTESVRASRSRSKSRGETMSRRSRIWALSRPKSQKTQKWAIQPAALPITIVTNQNPLKLPSLGNLEKLAKHVQVTKSFRHASNEEISKQKSGSKARSKSLGSSSEREMHSRSTVSPTLKSEIQRSISPIFQRPTSPLFKTSNSPKSQRPMSPQAKQQSISPSKSQRPRSSTNHKSVSPKPHRPISPLQQDIAQIPLQKPISVAPHQEKRIYHMQHASSEVLTHNMESSIKRLTIISNITSDAGPDKSKLAQKIAQDHTFETIDKRVEDDNKNVLIMRMDGNANTTEVIKGKDKGDLLPPKNVNAVESQQPQVQEKVEVKMDKVPLSAVPPTTATFNKTLDTIIKPNNVNPDSTTSAGFRILVDLKGFHNDEISMEVESRQLIFLASRQRRDDLNARKVTEMVDIPSQVNMENLKIGRRTDGCVLIEEHEQ